MTPSLDADVIIVGGGPAGSVAAFELSASGFDVLLLEKSGFPRYKVCGGGLTYKILGEIPFDIGPVIETGIYSVRFSKGMQNAFTRTGEIPLMYCSMRSSLDLFMVDKAAGEGTRVLFGQKVTEISDRGEFTEVMVKGRIFRSRLVIGADGASGIIAVKAGLKQDLAKGLAWEAEIIPPDGFLSSFSRTVFLDWGTFPGGYGWIFPKKDHVSVGVGGPAVLSAHMIPYYRRFLDSLGIRDTRMLSGDRVEKSLPGTLSLKAWPIPVRTRKGNFHRGNILVTGDAAGLTDPLTGEGIYYAVRSGRMAADAAREFLKGNPGALENYSGCINRELMTELVEAGRIRHVFNTFPERIHFWIRDNDRAWRAFGKVLRGERRYEDVKTGFGRWKFLWELVCFISIIASKVKEKRFVKNGLNG